MAKLTNPSEIARETLRQLALRRTLPTPDNYLALYHEIAGTQAKEHFPDRAMKELVAALPRETNDQARFARNLDSAVQSANWEAIRSSLSEFITKTASEPPNWAALIRELLTQLEKRHTGLTAAKKRESLEHVLKSGSADLLFSRMQSVVRSWGQTSISDEAESSEELSAELPVTPTILATPATASIQALSMADGAGVSGLKELVANLLENAIAMIVADDEALTREAADLAATVRAAQSAEQLAAIGERLKKLSYKLHFMTEDQAELKTALQHLIQLIIDNISELVADDHWLSGQISVVRELMHQPLSLRGLDDVERRMKDVIFKQSALKNSLNDAKDRLKQMLATFIDRLASFSESTSDYHDKIEVCAEKITNANDISELSDVLDEVMRETRVIQLNAERSRDELTAMRGRVNDAEREITRLQDELAHASEMVRHDPLTGALNRKGMNEAIEIEVARMRRQQGHLCLALLDIDNFKKLNDSLGHDAGDQALVHLSKVVHETIRPEDTLARYGGEEFVVLLPDTSVEDAVSAMIRVQRELTRRFFLHNNDKVLITFSCGVAEVGAQEDPFEALKRADAGMYLAKRAGKNRVVPT
jgi:diguanylate cyclase